MHGKIEEGGKARNDCREKQKGEENENNTNELRFIKARERKKNDRGGSNWSNFMAVWGSKIFH